jgi:S1-C subfamily serine protease
VHEETNPIETVKQGRIGISATPRAAEVAVLTLDSPAAAAGVRDFDLVTRLDGVPVANYEQLAQLVEAKLAQGATSLNLELRRREVEAPGGKLWADTPVQATIAVPAARRSSCACCATARSSR